MHNINKTKQCRVLMTVSSFVFLLDSCIFGADPAVQVGS